MFYPVVRYNFVKVFYANRMKYDKVPNRKQFIIYVKCTYNVVNTQWIRFNKSSNKRYEVKMFNTNDTCYCSS